MRTTALLCVLAIAACVTDDEPETSEYVDGIVSANRLAANRLAANKLSAGKLAATSLAAGSLANSPLAQTADGRDVLSYIVSCALPTGAQTSAKVGSTTYTFAGAIGLAPGWATRAPTVTERRWVTACVLARTNLYGVSVQLSLRGSHAALQGSLGELLGYLLVEGAFYGDLFDPAGPQMYACQTVLKDLGTGLSLSTEELRACSMPGPDGVTTKCGFTYVGTCNLLDVNIQPACNSLLFPYKQCRAGRAANAPRWDEVITVSLATGL